jgi:uncharacterized membrane protein
MASSSEARAIRAFREGIGRVNRAPAMLLGMALVTFLIALPLSLALRGMIEAHLGRSLAADTAASGTNYDWWQEFSAQASGLATTFVPSIIGFGAVLDNVAGLADNLPLATTIAVAIAARLVIWSFLSGGVLDRYARNRPTRVHGFFAAAGTHFWRFLRLGVLAFAAYYLLFAFVHGWLLDDLYGALTRNVTVERTAFFVRVACYAAFAALLLALNLVFDYARVRIVVEDRRSAIGALLASLRFLRRHRRAAYLYLLNTLAFLVLAGLYALAVPGAPGAGAWMWLTLIVGQLYIIGRHYLKLLFYASEVAFFQSAAAHAGYTAAPAVVWPDSPAVEAVLNADATAR